MLLLLRSFWIVWGDNGELVNLTTLVGPTLDTWTSWGFFDLVSVAVVVFPIASLLVLTGIIAWIKFRPKPRRP